MPDPSDLELSYRRCFGTEDGLIVIEDLYQKFMISNPFDKELGKMAFNAGQMNVVSYILALSDRLSMNEMEALWKKLSMRSRKVGWYHRLMGKPKK